MKVKVTDEGLLIPREVAERLGSTSFELFEEPGRLVIVAEPASSEEFGSRSGAGHDDPILELGRRPVHTGLRDGSTGHDRYLYGADG
jgi:hypothetical protein